MARFPLVRSALDIAMPLGSCRLPTVAVPAAAVAPVPEVPLVSASEGFTIPLFTSSAEGSLLF